MALLTLLSYAAAAICFVFVTLSLASGLLYLAEVIEEQSRAAKVFGTRAIYAIIGLHVLLWAVDSLPLPLVAFSIACHGVYLRNLGPLWPFISLTSPSFVASCVLVVADHFLWFHHFAGAMQDARRRAAATYHRPHLPVARAAEGQRSWRSPRSSASAYGSSRSSSSSRSPPTTTRFRPCQFVRPPTILIKNAILIGAVDFSRPGTPLPGQDHNAQKPSRSRCLPLFQTVYDSALDLAA